MSIDNKQIKLVFNNLENIKVIQDNKMCNLTFKTMIKLIKTEATNLSWREVNGKIDTYTYMPIFLYILIPSLIKKSQLQELPTFVKIQILPF